MSLTLEQYLALSVFDYDNLKPDDEDKPRYFTNQLLYGII